MVEETMGPLFRPAARGTPFANDSAESLGPPEDSEESASQWGQDGQQVRTGNEEDASRDPDSNAIPTRGCSFLLQGTHNEVHGAELPTSEPARAVPPRGQSVLHLHRAAQLGAGHKRIRQGDRDDSRGIRSGCHGA